MGSLKFASGTHLQQAFGERGIDVERTEQWYGEHIETEGVAVVDGFAMRAGDVTVHSHWLVVRLPSLRRLRLYLIAQIATFESTSRFIYTDK
jgi:hypothetical protein